MNPAYPGGGQQPINDVRSRHYLCAVDAGRHKLASVLLDLLMLGILAVLTIVSVAYVIGLRKLP
jgi:hypothetical protein